MKYKHLCLAHIYRGGGGGGLTTPTPTPIDTEFRRLCELGIFGFKYKTVPDPGISKPGHGPGAVEFLGSGDCFDAPSHIPNVFVVRVVNKIHIVNIAC